MANVRRQPLCIITAVTESAVRDGDLVIQGDADNKVKFPGGAAPTTPILGIVMRPDGSVASAGDVCNIVIGGIYPVRAGGNITRGDLITSNGADGVAKTEAAGAGVNVAVVGVALANGVSGDKVPVLIAQSIKQGA